MIMNRRLGRTSIVTSVLGMGGIPIQRCTSQQAQSIMDTCVREGIYFIDTARGYGASEALIGESIKGNRELFKLATKSPAKDKMTMACEIEKSLDQLQVEFIDLYQCHFVRDLDQLAQITGPGGAYEALVEARDDGKIKHIGITSHSVDVLKVAIETGLWESIQFPYNFVEIQGLDLFKRAYELGIGVLVMKPLAGGAIDHIDLSLRFILDNPHISVLIPGMDTVDQVIENATIVREAKPLSDEDRFYIERFRTTMGNRFCRRCGYCGPCPEGIDIPTMFTLEGYLTRYDLKEWARVRYNGLSKTAVDCIKCGLCEPKCPYDLPIREMLVTVAERFK